MNGDFVEKVSQTNTRNKSIADQNWVMNTLTPEERYDIKMQCISTRHMEEVQHWNPITEKVHVLSRLRQNPIYRDEKTGEIIFHYDSSKLKDAIKNTIKNRYIIKSKKTPQEYFYSVGGAKYEEYFEFLAVKTIKTACKNSAPVKRFFETEHSTSLGCILITEQIIDSCLASVLVPDIEIEKTNERENR